MSDAMASVRPHILVVEDEALVRMMVLDLATAAGFEVVGAGSADEALALAETGREIVLLFTDIDMPGTMDGLGLARFVREKWPATAIVVASGKHRPGADELPSDAVFLPKPYDPRDLVRTIVRIAAPRLKQGGGSA